MERRDSRRLSPAAQEELRRRAVAAVESGATRTEVARLFGVPRQTVGLWVAAYQEGGESALAAKRRGPKPGAGTRLAPWQAAQIAQALRDKRPEQLKLPFFLWTRDAVVELIERRFGVEVSRWTAGRYLMRWGFTPQKPMRRAFEQSDAAVRTWTQEEFPRVRREAKREGAAIYWADEMGLRSDHTVGRTFSPRGKTPVVRGTGQRFSCNVISAITNQGQMAFMVFQESFTVKVFLRFLRRLLRQNQGRKLYLIVDGHPVHRAKLVHAWLEKHAKRIRLIRLPSYSPELNPDEMLNQDVKSNALGRKRPTTLGDLMQSVRGYLRSRQRTPGIVRRYFLEPHVRYAAA
jgi:transposase